MKYKNLKLYNNINLIIAILKEKQGWVFLKNHFMYLLTIHNMQYILYNKETKIVKREKKTYRINIVIWLWCLYFFSSPNYLKKSFWFCFVPPTFQNIGASSVKFTSYYSAYYNNYNIVICRKYKYIIPTNFKKTINISSYKHINIIDNIIWSCFIV